MCTSLSDLETVKKAAQEGCRSYLVKPIQTDQLMKKVDAVLGPAKAIIGKRSDIMAELGLSARAYEDILAAFAELVANTIDALEPQAPPNDRTGASINMQNLAEGAALLGAEKLAAVLDRLPDGNGPGAPPAGHPLAPGLLRELKRLKRALANV